MVDWLRTMAALVAAAIAFVAWRTSLEALRATYRPVLRPVTVTVSATGYVHPAEMMLKNIGRGPAVGVQVFNYPGLSDAAALGTTDVIYPEKDIPPAVSGVARFHGQISLSADADLDPPPGKTYRILYQDLSGLWHESHATYGPRQVLVTYLGAYRWWHWFWSPNRRIPRAAINAAHVVRPIES